MYQPSSIFIFCINLLAGSMQLCYTRVVKKRAHNVYQALGSSRMMEHEMPNVLRSTKPYIVRHFTYFYGKSKLLQLTFQTVSIKMRFQMVS